MKQNYNYSTCYKLCLYRRSLTNGNIKSISSKLVVIMTFAYTTS